MIIVINSGAFIFQSFIICVNSSRVEFELPMLEVGVRVPVHASSSPVHCTMFLGFPMSLFCGSSHTEY